MIPIIKSVLRGVDSQIMVIQEYEQSQPGIETICLPSNIVN